MSTDTPSVGDDESMTKAQLQARIEELEESVAELEADDVDLHTPLGLNFGGRSRLDVQEERVRIDDDADDDDRAECEGEKQLFALSAALPGGKFTELRRVE